MVAALTLEWDEVVMPHPPVRRALAWTVEALHRNGHKVYPIRPFKHAEICALFDEIMQLDRGSDHDLLTEKSGEPILWVVSRITLTVVRATRGNFNRTLYS